MLPDLHLQAVSEVVVAPFDKLIAIGKEFLNFLDALPIPLVKSLVAAKVLLDSCVKELNKRIVLPQTESASEHTDAHGGVFANR